MLAAADPIATFTHLLLKAQTAALEKLTALLETSDDPREVRRIATTLLKIKPPQPAPATPAAPPHSHHAAPEPLLPAELDDLRRLFPDTRVTHFTSTHSPAYWRGLIFRHATPAQPGASLTTASARAPSPGSRAAAP